jgi:hypothetical protein
MEDRSSPLFSQLVLWILFAVLAVASIFTVLLPALTSEEPSEEREQSSR